MFSKKRARQQPGFESAAGTLSRGRRRSRARARATLFGHRRFGGHRRDRGRVRVPLRPTCRAEIATLRENTSSTVITDGDLPRDDHLPGYAQGRRHTCFVLELGGNRRHAGSGQENRLVQYSRQQPGYVGHAPPWTMPPLWPPRWPGNVAISIAVDSKAVCHRSSKTIMSTFSATAG